MVTGGIRLQRMIGGGKIDRPMLYIDTYNQSTLHGIFGTIKARIDSNCMYFISLEHNKDRKEQTMIAQINVKTRECRLFDIRKLSPRECLRLMAVPEHYIDRMMQTTERTYSAISGCEEELRLLDLTDSATPRDIREAAEQAIKNLKETDNDTDETDEREATAGLDAARSEEHEHREPRDDGQDSLHRQCPQDDAANEAAGSEGVSEERHLSDTGSEVGGQPDADAVSGILAARDTLLRAERVEKTAPVPLLANSALYKLAGNSICANVLLRIYEEALYPTGRRLPTEQPSLFDLPQFRLERDWQREPFRLISLCSGYDSQAIALDMLQQQHPDFRWTLTAWSEFDPESSRPLDQQPAVVAHRLCFPNAGPNLGDMTRIDWQDFMHNPQKYYDNERRDFESPDGTGDGYKAGGKTPDERFPDRIEEGDIDLLTYSTPCQSISQAGKREGMAKGSGTRSSVLWSTADAIEALRPKMLLQENVRAIINQQNIRHFRQWMQTVSDLGYENFLAPSFTLPNGERTTASILNARDYGIPQNRDRMFLVSIRKDLLRGTQYEFPRPFPLTQCIADVLEPDASPALYLKPESVTSFLQKNEDGQQQYIYATVSHRPTSTQIDALIAEQTTV